MTWKLEYTQSADRQLSKLDRRVARDIKVYLGEVCQLDDPAVRGHTLSNSLAGLHRYRLGQIRIIVEIQRTIVQVLVIKIERRDSAY